MHFKIHYSIKINKYDRLTHKQREREREKRRREREKEKEEEDEIKKKKSDTKSGLKSLLDEAEGGGLEEGGQIF